VLNYHQCRHWLAALAGCIGSIYASKYIGYCIAENENNYIVAGFTCIPVRGLNPTAEFAMTAFLGVTMPANSIQPSTGMKPRLAYMLKLVVFVAVCERRIDLGLESLALRINSCMMAFPTPLLCRVGSTNTGPTPDTSPPGLVVVSC
jgi:hypothetical protein